MKLDKYLTGFTKVKQSRSQNYKVWEHKNLGESIRKKPRDFGGSDELLDTTVTSWYIKGKYTNWTKLNWTAHPCLLQHYSQ
jgi:hypothetical protein